MLAVFKTGGKQYHVKAGQKLRVEKLEGNKGDSISFKEVLAVSDASIHTIGNPLVKGASVQAKILEQIRDKKIIVFKKRQRQNYRLTQGHRQYITLLQIEFIALGDKKSSAPKKEIVKKISKTKDLVNKEAKKKTAPIKKKKLPKKNSIKKKVSSKTKTQK